MSLRNLDRCLSKSRIYTRHFHPQTSYWETMMLRNTSGFPLSLQTPWSKWEFLGMLFATTENQFVTANRWTFTNRPKTFKINRLETTSTKLRGLIILINPCKDDGTANNQWAYLRLLKMKLMEFPKSRLKDERPITKIKIQINTLKKSRQNRSQI